MSEIVQTNAPQAYRRRLLATASMMAVIVAAYSAQAADGDRPTVWIEGGYHFENISGSHEPLVPPLDAAIGQAGFTPPGDFQNVLASSYGAEGKISFQPEKSDWSFSVSFRYGRAHGSRYAHQEKDLPSTQFTFYNPFAQQSSAQTVSQPAGYEDIKTREVETHTLIDFQVGRDVGVGLFGHHSESVAGFGVRYAQFTASSHAQVYARPGGHFVDLKENLIGTTKYVPIPFYHNSSSVADRTGSFHGIGPSLSWSNSTPLIGDEEDGEIAFDWGVNAALLFGRQKVKVHHDATDTYHSAVSTPNPTNPAKYVPAARTSTDHTFHDGTRTRSVTVPNLGGFAGVSYRFTNAKLSVGYRVDYFFDAMDGGLDAHKSVTTGFRGPFAKLSIGLGG